MFYIWARVNDRLDRPWKRVAFILWAPLFIATMSISAYAALCVYQVYLSKDADLWFCHRDIAGFAHRPGNFDEEDMRAISLAHSRMESRFAAETLRVESSPEFLRCMAKTNNASYWANYSFAWHQALLLAACTGFIALIIFPRFWRLIGGWIAGTPR